MEEQLHPSKALLEGSDAICGITLDSRYQIKELLGTGAWSRVYLAEQILLHKEVAVKILHRHLAFSSDRVERFRHEATILSKLDHPNLCVIYDLGQTDDKLPYFVMDRIKGKTLADLIAESGFLSPAQCQTIFVPVCRALQAAHSHGIVHRDIKPSNIIIDKDESGTTTIKVIDFGLGKFVEPDEESARSMTRTGETLGTPAYMSPEQCMAARLDGRSDIYSVGCVMYEALSGMRPIAGETGFECMTNHLQTPPLPFAKLQSKAQVPKHWEAIVFKALQKLPSHRYRSMKEMLEDLERVENYKGEPLHAHKLPSPPLNARLVAAMLIVACLLCAFAGVGLNAESSATVACGLFGNSIQSADLQVRLSDINRKLGNIKCADEQLAAAVSTLSRALSEAGSNHQLALCESILKHLEDLCARYRLPKKDVAELYKRMGDRYVDELRSDDAERMYVKAYRYSYHPSNFRLQLHQAVVLCTTGLAEYEKHKDPRKAEQVLLHSAAILDTLDGKPNQPSGSELQHQNTLRTLAWIHQHESGRTQDSVNALKKALQIDQVSIANTPAHQASMMREIGEMSFAGKRYDEAREWFLKSIALCQNLPAKNQLGISLCALGDVDHVQKRYAQAAIDYERGVDLLLTSPRYNYWLVSASIDRAVDFYTAQKDWAKAEAVYKRGLNWFAAHHADKDTNVVSLLEGYASMLTAQGRLQEAKKVLTQIHDINLAPKPAPPETAGFQD